MPRAHLPDSRDFSFSGVKAHLARLVRGKDFEDTERARLAAAYQESIALALTQRVIQVADEVGGPPIFVVGGVARNARLRELLASRASQIGLRVNFPDPKLCTDNAAMVAAAGAYKLTLAGPDSPHLDCSANLPLESWPKKNES